jgi:hypothetical protein
MKKVLNFFLDHGLAIMTIGFLISFISLLVFMFNRHADYMVRQISFGTTIGGFVVYALGRIGVFMQKRIKSKTPDMDNGGL